MDKIKIFCATLLIICIPIITLTFSANVAVRYPEVLTYYLNDSEVMNYTDIDMTAGELAKEVGGFFWSFDDDDQILQDNGYSKDPVFNDREMQVLLQIRSAANVMALCGIVALLILVGVYVYMMRTNKKDSLWKYCKKGAVVAVVINAIYNILWAIPAVRGFLYDNMTNVVLDKDSNLFLMATKGDWSSVLIFAQSAIAIILILLICYITRKITRSRRIFTR